MAFHFNIFAAKPPKFGPEPLELKAPRRRAIGSVIGHTGFNVARYHTTHVFGGLFPLLAGALLFGWRAIVSILIVVGTTLLAGMVWRKLGTRGHTLRPAHLLWLGLVVGLMLPANLLQKSSQPALWPLLPAAGLLIVILNWALGGVGSRRFHPALVVYLLLALIYGLSTQTMLQRNRLLLGDLLAAPHPTETKAAPFAWRMRSILASHDALHCTTPADALLNFTRRLPTDTGNVGNTSHTLEKLLRDELPPMEDLVLGAVPGGNGVTSAVAVIVGGLFLLYRGLIDFRIPLLITLAAWCTLMVLPIPNQSHGTSTSATLNSWIWLPGHTKDIGWAMAVTLANYQVLASPLLFTAFFLAGSPHVRPLTKRGRTTYSILIGVFAAVLQMYLSVRLGSYIALMTIGLFTPVLDRYLQSRPLV